MPWLTLLTSFLDGKKLLRGVAGASAAIVMGLVLQQLIEAKHQEAKAWFTEGEARISKREDERYMILNQAVLEIRADVRENRQDTKEILRSIKNSQGGK